MKIIIDMAEEKYEWLKENNPKADPNSIVGAVVYGKPLPKGHGRLIDADAELEGLRKMKVVDEKDKQSVRFAILEYENAPTIIEADYGEEEGEVE